MKIPERHLGRVVAILLERAGLQMMKCQKCSGYGYGPGKEWVGVCEDCRGAGFELVAGVEGEGEVE